MLKQLSPQTFEKKEDSQNVPLPSMLATAPQRNTRKLTSRGPRRSLLYPQKNNGRVSANPKVTTFATHKSAALVGGKKRKKASITLGTRRAAHKIGRRRCERRRHRQSAPRKPLLPERDDTRRRAASATETPIYITTALACAHTHTYTQLLPLPACIYSGRHTQTHSACEREREYCASPEHTERGRNFPSAATFQPAYTHFGEFKKKTVYPPPQPRKKIPFFFLQVSPLFSFLAPFSRRKRERERACGGARARGGGAAHTTHTRARLRVD